MAIKLKGKLGEHPQFGPLISRFRMTDKVLAILNADCIKSTTDHSDKLVGTIEKQLLASTACIDDITDFFMGCIQEHAAVASSAKQVKLGDVWYNRMLEPWEFNPIHFHTNCVYSSVGYLKTPDDGTKCDISFFMDGAGDTPAGPVTYSPVVGDFYTFPWYLQHYVSPMGPFKGERRSVAINFVDAAKGGRTI